MCYVETANLDGETNLKIRQVKPSFMTGVVTEPTLQIWALCVPVSSFLQEKNLLLMVIP